MITLYVSQSTVKDMLTLYSTLSSTMYRENIAKIRVQNLYTNWSFYCSHYPFDEDRYHSTTMDCIFH